MDNQVTELPWEEPDWLQQITAWIEDHLSASGRHSTGSVEVLHQRPWAAFARLDTNQGTVYFKAPAPGSYYEAAVTEALTRWRPDCNVPVLAVDLERGWLLSADAGVTLRIASPSVEQVEHWVKLMPLCVELQLQMAEHVPELLAFGMPDRCLAKLPQLYAQLLEDDENLRVGLTPGLSSDQYRSLRDLRPQVGLMCEELANYGFPETLTHEEVHDANILINSDGQYIFTDWSDSSIAHPFFSMLITIRAAAHRLKLAEDGLEMARVRDAYLEPWTEFETREKISAAYALAYRLGMINRALSWQQGPGSLSKKINLPYVDAVPEWLQDFLMAQKSA